MNQRQRVALAQKNLMVKDIGNRLNMNSGYISIVLSGRAKPRKLRQKIAEILGKPVEYLWPEDNQ
jgi:hypothetical protein